MVIWLTGLSGAGKTTVGRELCALWRINEPGTVLVDGDDVRRVLGRFDGDDAYTPAGRREVAQRIVAICRWLDDQQINVVCCTISAFPDLLECNRKRFSRYFEVLLDAPMEVVARRSPSDLYRRARRGEVSNVIGVDLPFVSPPNPDLIIDNRRETDDFESIAADILAKAIET